MAKQSGTIKPEGTMGDVTFLPPNVSSTALRVKQEHCGIQFSFSTQSLFKSNICLARHSAAPSIKLKIYFEKPYIRQNIYHAQR